MNFFNNERFFSFDNEDEENRVITFSFDACLKLLSEAESWFIDNYYSLASTFYL